MTTRTSDEENRLGARLRELRQDRGRSLREVASRAGVNHGYLSQLERGEVAEPTPSMLHKLAAGYGEPFVVLMRWAGYVEDAPDLTENQARALSYLGDNPTDAEVDAIKAILEVIREKRALFAHSGASLDTALTPQDHREIAARVRRLLEHADAYQVIPTPLDQVLDASQLAIAGDIDLTHDERKRLRTQFGDLLDRVLVKLQGAILFRAREVWVKPDMQVVRKRFVTAHEIGHDVLEWQRDVIAYLDREQQLRSDVRELFERQANQAAIELLAQGGELRRRADDSRLTIDLFSELGSEFEISLQATSRRVVEQSKQEAALAIRFRGRTGSLGPYHIYCSSSFQGRFGWQATGLPTDAMGAVQRALQEGDESSVAVSDSRGSLVPVEVETVDTRWAVLALFKTPVRRRAKRLIRVA